jgi:hypothetical protein
VTTVAVLGGGVPGLSAAHELVERGFDVTVPNFFVASDFVRTFTDLATMEGANEAARRAVNGVLDATGSAAPRCQVFPLQEPGVLEPFRKLDLLRWRLGRLAAKPLVRLSATGQPEPIGVFTRGLLALVRRFG